LPSREAPALAQADGEAKAERLSPALTAGLWVDVEQTQDALWLANQDGELWRVGLDGAWSLVDRAPGAGIISLAVDGADVALLDDQGRVRLSQDAGKTWAALREPPKDFPRSLARVPVLAEVPYHALAMRRVGGELHVALVGLSTWAAVSRDGGKTWAESRLGDLEALTSVAIAPDGAVYAVGERGKGFALRAGDSAWVATPQKDKPHLSAVAVDAKRGEVVLAAGSAGDLRRSLDGGATWEALPGRPNTVFTTLRSFGPDRWVAGASSGEVLLSSDGGKTWKLLQAGDGRAVKAVAAAPTGEGFSWVGDEVVGLHTPKDPKHPKPRRLRGDAERGLYAVARGGPGVGAAVGDLGLMMRAQGGAWEPVVKTPPVQRWASVAFGGGGRFGWAASREGGLARTQDGGRSWQPVALGTKDKPAPGLWAVKALDARNVFAAGDAGSLWSSQDSGASWGEVALPSLDPDKVGAPALRALAFEGEAGSARLWVGGERSVLLAGSPGRKDLALTDLSFSPGVVDLESAPQGRAWLLDLSGMILRRDPVGGRWEVLALPPGLALSSLVFDPQGRGLMLGASGVMLRSEDAGARWSLVSHRSPRLLHAMAWAGGDAFVAVGHGGHIHRSGDAGQTWAALKVESSRSLNAVARWGDKLVAVGFGGAALESADQGQSWKPWADAPPDLAHTHLTALARGEDGAQALGAVNALWIRPPGGAWAKVEAEGGPLGEVRRVRLGPQGAAVVVTALGELWTRDPGQPLRRWGASLPPGKGGGWRDVWIEDWASLKGVALWDDHARAVALREPPQDTPQVLPWGQHAARLEGSPVGLWVLGQRGLFFGARGGAPPAVVLPALPFRPVDLSFADAKRGAAVAQGGVLMVTRDGGERWELVPTGTKTDLHAVSLGTDGEIWAVGRGGLILRATLPP
jgi:photosystem II stability/assembly factor-like uncharacterized protein